METTKQLKVVTLKNSSRVTYIINGSTVFDLEKPNKFNFEHCDIIEKSVRYRLQSEPDLTLISKVKVEQNNLPKSIELLSITSIYQNDKS